MNWLAAAEYLKKQSKFCTERARAERKSADNLQIMVLLADIYATLANALLVGIGEAPYAPSLYEPEETTQ